MSTGRFQEIVLAVLALIWAVALALPDDVLGRVRAYTFMNRFLPDNGWAVILAVCSLIILMMGRVPGPRMWWKAQAHVILGILWLVIVVLIFSNSITAGTVLIATPFLAMACLHIFEYFKLAQLARL